MKVHVLLATLVSAALEVKATPCGPDCTGTCFAGSCLFAERNVDDGPQPSSDLSAYAPGAPAALDSQLLHQTMPSATVTAALGFQSVGVLESKAQELSYELQRAEAHDALLRAQNEQLRQQLDKWKTAGSDIAQREAKVMSLLSPPATAAANLQRGNSSNSAATPGAAAQPGQSTSLLQSARQMLQQSSSGPGYLGPIIGLLGSLIIVGIFWRAGCVVQSLRKGEITWNSMSQAFANSPNSQRLQPMLRAMGLVQYKVEVSEIHLGSLFAGSTDIRVHFRMGNGVERPTKMLRNAGSTFVRFDDNLELSLCGSDPPCTICVADSAGDVAHVEISATQFLRLATRPHQEYFRTELIPARDMGELSGRRPYVAMRLRNISAPPAAVAAMVASASKVEQRVYGSFTV